MSKKILVLKSSPRGNNAVSNQLVDILKAKFETTNASFTERDISKGFPFVTETLIHAYFSDPLTHTDEQKAEIAISDELTNELLAHDILVIGLPLYNFSIPAALKSYIDLIVRAGVTFKYNEPGKYVGLVKDKKVYLVLAAGGVPIGSAYELASSYLKNVLGFIGITDVVVLGATGTNNPSIAEEEFAKAKAEIESLSLN